MPVKSLDYQAANKESLSLSLLCPPTGGTDIGEVSLTRQTIFVNTEQQTEEKQFSQLSMQPFGTFLH